MVARELEEEVRVLLVQCSCNLSCPQLWHVLNSGSFLENI